MKLWICGLIVLVSVVAIFVIWGENRARAYSVISDGMISLSWMYCALILVTENSRSLPHDWVLKTWFMLAFVLACVRLQTMTNLWEQEQEFSAEDVFYILRLVLYALITILALYVTDEKDKFKEVRKEEEYKLLEEPPETNGYGSLNTTFAVARERTSPEESANVFSKALFHWAGGLFSLGFKRALENEDLWPLIRKDQAQVISYEFERVWGEEKEREKPSLAKAIVRVFGPRFLLYALPKLANDMLVFAGPILLNLMIRFLENSTWPLYYGLMIALAFFLTGFSQTLFFQYYFFCVVRIGQRLRSAIVTAVYRKAFNISSKSRQQFTTGEIVNHMAIDANTLKEMGLLLPSFFH